MGSDDGHGPHANKNDAPLTPRGGGEPCGDLPGKPNSPSVAKTVQTEAPSSYAIAGKVMFAAAGAFAGILLALIALHMYNSGRRRCTRDRRRLLRSLANISGGGGSGDAVVPNSPRARGLDPAVLRALPVVVAVASGSSGVGGAGGGGDCAVCLAEFERGEEARALPRCGHRFHVECIDAWFRGNSTCPLCRADVEAPAPDDAEAQPAEEVRIDVVAWDAAAKGGAPEMPSGGSSLRPDPLPSES